MGSTIHLAAGEYIETEASIVPQNTNIVGAGVDKTVINSQVKYEYPIVGSSIEHKAKTSDEMSRGKIAIDFTGMIVYT